MSLSFTDQAKKVMEYAREESVRLGHNYIGTEHLLLGILKDGKGEAVNVLGRLGVKLETLRQSIEDYVSSSGGAKTDEEVQFSPRSKQVVEMATYEAKEMQTQFVGVEHLLLALLKDGEGVACQILKAFGVDHNTARQELVIPGAGAKGKVREKEQKVFILYYCPIIDHKNIIEKTNLDELNKLLAEGWTMSGKEDMGGRGVEGFHVSFLTLSRNVDKKK